MKELKPSELRIGNHIFNGIITEIHKDYFKFHDGYQTWKSKEMLEGAVEPIPITEQWLLDFGFEKGGYDFLFWYKDGLEFAGINWADKDIAEYQFLTFNFSEDKTIQIHYVHQLQNLYFALTSEELILNK